ncbi:hypothetical protein ILUMI_17517 [Ignelater luminosus]|uniref:Mariner Mos1 transposase n=1 Tax=Ignelater luminosus TaxID=2038154 RepID=A0A8K0CPA3_IGNLU|nr:hypothetical protein ILUMI_17517 [Ignelater luminosus]
MTMPQHSAKLTTKFLRSAGIKLMSHSPYTPDLAFCDFFLFPTIKKKLCGIHFLTSEEAANAFEEHVSAVSKET